MLRSLLDGAVHWTGRVRTDQRLQERVWKSSCKSNREERRHERQGRDLDQYTGMQLVVDDDRGNDGKTKPLSGEQAQDGHVVNFRDDAGADAKPVHQRVELLFILVIQDDMGPPAVRTLAALQFIGWGFCHVLLVLSAITM